MSLQTLSSTEAKLAWSDKHRALPLMSLHAGLITPTSGSHTLHHWKGGHGDITIHQSVPEIKLFNWWRSRNLTFICKWRRSPLTKYERLLFTRTRRAYNRPRSIQTCSSLMNVCLEVINEMVYWSVVKGISRRTWYFYILPLLTWLIEHLLYLTIHIAKL